MNGDWDKAQWELVHSEEELYPGLTVKTINCSWPNCKKKSHIYTIIGVSNVSGYNSARHGFVEVQGKGYKVTPIPNFNNGNVHDSLFFGNGIKRKALFKLVDTINLDDEIAREGKEKQPKENISQLPDNSSKFIKELIEDQKSNPWKGLPRKPWRLK
jgi:hypothetical protein